MYHERIKLVICDIHNGFSGLTILIICFYINSSYHFISSYLFYKIQLITYD